MIFEALVAFTCAAHEANSIGDADNATSRRDKTLVKKLTNYGVHGRPLNPQKASECFLCQFNAVPSPVLRGKQPASGALRDRVEGIARHRLHHLGEQVI